VRIYYNESNEDIGDKVREMINELFKKMELEGGVKDIKEGENKVYVELESKTGSGLIIGKKGKTLEALQFMVNLMINNLTGSEKKIILDIESYRDKREKALKKMSREMAQKVIKTGRPLTLEPMNPFERRLIHLTLQNDKRVTTKARVRAFTGRIRFPC
jgi:spoIIIJ-associated protein